jgi:hypothetical protein
MIFWLLVYLLTLVPETQRGHILIYLRFYRIHDIHVYYNLIWWKLSVLCCVVCVCLFLFCPMFFPVSLCCLFSVAPLVFASFYSQISTSTDIQRKHKLLKWYTFYFWTLGWLSTWTYLFFSNLHLPQVTPTTGYSYHRLLLPHATPTTGHSYHRLLLPQATPFIRSDFSYTEIAKYSRSKEITSLIRPLCYCRRVNLIFIAQVLVLLLLQNGWSSLW